jgi:hypothetical protein
MGGGVRRRSVLTRDDLSALQGDHNHVIGGHLAAGDTTWLDCEDPGLALGLAGVAESLHDEPRRIDVMVGFSDQLA